MYKILVVEDDNSIREVICEYFENQGCGEIAVSTAADGDMGMELIYENEYDLLLLDIMMPGADGLTLCRKARKKSAVPIIFITAKGRQEDVLLGYDFGCDDYIVKPFRIAELYAKVWALLKRSKGLVLGEDIICGNIVMNPARFTVRVSDTEIDLPPKQYALLKYLMENKNLVVERDSLLTKIWGYDYEGNERVLDNHIKKLRHALGDAGNQIKTVIMKGYKIVD